MKLLIVIVATAALGAVAGALYMGARLMEPTVVADPYQAGLHYDEHRHGAGSTPTAPSPPTSTPSPTRPTASNPCDLQRGPCTQLVAGGGEVTLDVGPRPIRAMRDLEFTLTIAPASAGAGAEVALALGMPGMYMGETRAALAPVGEGVFRGKGVLVRCPSGRRDWSADVLLRRAGPQGDAAGGAQVLARFPLTVVE